MPYLNTFSGDWTAKEARCLLNRTSFGVTETMVSEAVQLGLQATIEKLFEVKNLPEPPLKYQLDGSGRNEINDPEAKYGETWVNAKPLPEAVSNQDKNRIINSRKKSLYAWSYLQMQNTGISIREKLTLFWHNHFVAENNLL
jgi:hypothetical protein